MKRIEKRVQKTLIWTASAFVIIFLCLSGIPSVKEKIILSIDSTQCYQRIEGFGAFNTISYWKDESYEKKIKFLADDLGLSILRLELPPTFHNRPDSTYNLDGWVFGGPGLQQNFNDVRELRKRGVDKFIASIWSPPAWMKTLNSEGKGPSTEKGGSLRKEAYEDFAAYCAEYCKVFRKETGTDLYAIGLQNEPEFVEPYNSCVYAPEQMREALRAVGRKFRKDGIHTKIYLPEALPAQQHISNFFNAINEDQETRQYADIFAIHNYDRDGMKVGGAGAKEWESFYSLASSVPPAKQLWMTETSGHANNWEGAMLLAANIYNALKYGNLNAWIWWAIADKKSSEVYALIIDGKPTSRYFVSKHFYRFVRPGATRIEVKSNHDDVLALAFKNSGKDKVVCILINKSDKAVQVFLPDIKNSILTEVYLSTSTLNCEKQAGDRIHEIDLPASSIITLVWK